MRLFLAHLVALVSVVCVSAQTNSVQLRNGANSTTILPSSTTTVTLQIPALTTGTHYLLTSTTNPGSSGAAGSFLTYGATSAQNTFDISATGYLFNVGYAATAVEQHALGGSITSTATGTNKSATALSLAATKTGTGTATALYITNGSLTFTDSDDSHITSFTTGNQAVDINYTLPTTAGTNGQALITNGSGVLSWGAAGATTLDGLSDAKSGGANFTNSLLLGHESVTPTNAEQNTGVGLGGVLQALTSGDQNTAVGYGAADAVSSGYLLTAIGYNALGSASSAARIVAIGTQAGESITTGDYSVFIGSQAGQSITNVTNAVAVGYGAMRAATGSDNNVAIGTESLNGLTSGTRNVAIGTRAGNTNVTTGSGNVFIGDLVSPSTNVSNKLYIDNSTTDSPLILGDFDANTLTFNGAITTTGASALNGDITLGTGTSATGGSIIMHDNATGSSFTSTILSADLAASRNYTIPDAGADASFVMTQGAQTVTGTKTFASAAVFNTSAKLKSSDGTGGVILQAGAMSNTDVTYTLPLADGTSGYYMSTNGSGTLSWAANSLDNLSDAKSGGTDFSRSMILGHQTTGTLSAAADNTGVGYGTLESITSGQNNTAIGSQSGISVTSGERNTYLGSYAGRDGSGSNNTYIGSLSGGPWGGTTSGSENTGVGATALNEITTGQKNVAIGKDAGFWLTSGSSNVLIGWSAGNSLTTESNRLYISNSNDATPLIYGEFDTDILRFNGRVGIGGAPGATYELDVAGDINYSGAISNTSDARLKRNILPLVKAMDVVQKLRPVSYEKRANLQSNDYNMKQMGFIAQELEKVLPNSVSTDKSEDAIKSVDYISLIPVLTKALQEQQQMINKQQAEIDELRQLIKRMSVR